MPGILKKVAQEFKKYAKEGAKRATFPVTKLAKKYQATDFKKPIEEIANTPIPKLDNQKNIIEYWQAMCKNYDKNYNKVFRKYYERNISNQINVRKTGVAALFVKDLHELFKMSQEDIKEIMKKLNAREQWLRNANPNGLKRDIDNTLKKLGISRPDVSKDKKITIGEYVASILDNPKVLKAIGKLNTKLNWISSEINKLALDSPKKQAPQPPKAKFTHPNKPQPSLPLPDGPAPQPPKATASKTPQSPIKLPSAPPISKEVNHNVLLNSISNIFLSLKFEKKLTPEEQLEFNALKKYFKDNAQSTVNKIMNLKNDQARNDWVKYFIDKPFNKIMTYEEFRNYLYSKDGLFQEMLKDGIRVNGPIPKNLPKGVKLPTQKQPSDKTVTSVSEPPKKPQPPIPQQPTGQGNAKPTAEQLKNASGSLKKVANPMTSKRKSVVEQVFENTTNSPMFKRAQQQNQTQDEDDDDAWTD
ncbi:MAG: hypothetical protein IJG00_05715 [Clostridia bacterium]|nr:hypothetical protein [Clostridia bacterium]